MAITRAEAYFEKFTGPNALQELQKLVPPSQPTFENEWLDFKSGLSKEKDIPRIWSKAISAFANNEGGILVWGIQADKDPKTGVDMAQRLQMVPDILKLRSRLNELAPFATDPPVQGIQLLEIPAGLNEGFVVCLIPESGNKPHRSEQADHQFFLRVGDASKVCSVSLLRQLFFPQTHFHLEVGLTTMATPLGFPMLRLPHARKPGNHVKCLFELAIENKSEWSMEHVYFSIASCYASLFTYCYEQLDDDFRVELLQSFNQAAFILHPGMRTRFQLAMASTSQQDIWPINLAIFCKNSRFEPIEIPAETTLNFRFAKSLVTAA